MKSFDVTRVEKLDPSSGASEEVDQGAFQALLAATPPDLVRSRRRDIDYDEGTLIMALGAPAERFRVTVGSLKEPGRKVSAQDIELDEAAEREELRAGGVSA